MSAKTDKRTEAEIANEKRKKHKQAKDKLLAKKVKTGGLFIVHTGKGKGKTTAAMGMVARCIGHGIKVGIVQFVKGKWETGERVVLEAFPDLVDIKVMGEGFTWETQDVERDKRAAEKAWHAAIEMISSGEYGLVLLDEINIVLRYDYLDAAEVAGFIANRPADVHVICTGRNAKKELMDAAETVIEMTEHKHHFRADFKAQAGIEF